MPFDLDLSDIFQAASFAARKHAGQFRKDKNRSPYITHPLAVARTLWEVGEVHDPLTLIAALLHDTVEDTDTSPDEIEAKFGTAVKDVVMEVTDDKSLPKIVRKHLQVAHAPNLSRPAKLLKLGDKIVNCRDILTSPPADWTLQRRRDYIQWAADVIAGLRGTNAVLENTFDQIAAEAEEKLNYQIQSIDTLKNRPWRPHASS